MSDLACDNKNTAEEQSANTLRPLVTGAATPCAFEDFDSGEESVNHKEKSILANILPAWLRKDIPLAEKQTVKNPLDDIDTEGEDAENISPCATVVPSNTPVTGDSGHVSPSNTPVTGDSGHVSPIMEDSPDSLSDGTQQQQDERSLVRDAAVTVAAKVTATLTSTASPILTKDNTISSPSSAKTKAVKENKKEEKKKSKRKEDKGGEHILRALNSLQSPEEKLAALCKKFADLHEENRVLQTSFKAQQRTLTVVAREKEQIQSEHTKAMMAKSKLESLCRELQKHNKIIENESIKRAKESEDKRKEISAHFNTTITEIQNQMTDNSEKNSDLRKENENLADQLRSFIAQCQARDEHVKKLQEQHELENKLAAARLVQAEAIIKDAEERGSKEKELILLKLTEMTKKAHLTETQLELYKSKYDEFNDLHTRSNETFQKYKAEMDKMTKRIKKLEKDGLQWKTKWEASNKALLEQKEAKAKSEQEATVCDQKVKKLESLCRALQAELHRQRSVSGDKGEVNAPPVSPVKDDRSASTAPPNSPQPSSSSENSPGPSSKKAAVSTDSPSSSPESVSSSTTPASPNVPEAAEATELEESPSCSAKGLPDAPVVGVVGPSSCEHDQSSSDSTVPSSSSPKSASLPGDEEVWQEPTTATSEVTADADCNPTPRPPSS